MRAKGTRLFFTLPPVLHTMSEAFKQSDYTSLKIDPQKGFFSTTTVSPATDLVERAAAKLQLPARTSFLLIIDQPTNSL